MKKLLAFISLLLSVLMISGCSNVVAESNDLMNGIKTENVATRKADNEFYDSQLGFATKLFQMSIFDSNYKNTLVSPLSVMLALSMTANGADGDTLSQMEELLGQNIPIDALNEYLKGYASSLPDDKGGSLKLANSIWFRNTEGFEVKKDFLQKNANFYSADAFKVPFDNSVKEINGWVNKNTNGMIDKVIDEIKDSTLMYLINALCFDAEWEDIYEEGAVFKRDFKNLGGDTKRVEMMHNTESVYLEDKNTKGFIKYYKGRNYAFAALLPEDEDFGREKEDYYITNFTAEKIKGLLESAKKTAVHTAVPKFKYDYTVELSDILSKLGMKDAFDHKKSDFSKISDTNLFISSVLHKTFISVDERGTKAGAVTVIAADGTAMKEMKEVILDRPFIYMILDCKNNLPIFIGAVTEL